MALKFFVVLASIAVASAGIIPATSIYQPTLLASKSVEPIDLRPQYTFSYGVKDLSTGDIKSQVESRDGEVVKGSYSLLDADGLTRVVQYESDPVNGFNAVVQRTPLGKQAVGVAAQPNLVKGIPTVIQSAPAVLRSSQLAYGPSIYGPSVIKSVYGI